MKKLIRVIIIAILTALLTINQNGDFQLGTQRALAADNPIVTENALPGNPKSEWDINGAGSENIQGFTTDIGYNRGETVNFKIKVSSSVSNYRLDIYRMGYYGGNGARKVATVQPNTQQINNARNQAACTTDPTTALYDCVNWNVSAIWTIPTTSTSGIYFAKAVITGGITGSSHIVFIVRDDSSKSDVLFQTSDTTWQAYNTYDGDIESSGISLYQGGPGVQGGAYKVSYNRPFNTRVVDGGHDWLFNAEYPMVRWLEANGYDVSYFTGVDSDRNGDLINNHKIFLSVGHDEYWSKQQRQKVEAARDAGVHIGFFSSNEIYWKTRWENNYRTLVCYKETHANDKIDPSAEWTGTWRDPRFSPPADGGRPENALSGTLFTVNDGATTSIQVPAADGKMRFWRNTRVANLSSGSVATFPYGTLGYEWDEDIDNGFRPAGALRMSTTTVENAPVLIDYGSNFAPGTATHHLILYKYKGSSSKDALVFGSGTLQWSWGLDSNHDNGSEPADVSMQQATVNLFADMGVQPSTLQSGLVQAFASGDIQAPTSTISSPSNNTTVQTGTQVTISGTASDIGGGVVGGVEVSDDGGITWHPANGRANWNYTWLTPNTSGEITIKSRAVDDSGNLETPGDEVTVNVGNNEPTSSVSIWNNSATPSVTTENDSSAVNLGVKFRSSRDGKITAIRFYKGSQNIGTHIGILWTSTGNELARATFTNETNSGWQEARFTTSVPINADTVYVASYHAPVGRYSQDVNYFANSGVSNPPLYALRDGESGSNGVYTYSSTPAFPDSTYESSNYWVDVVFTPDTATDTTLPTVTAITPSNDATGVSTSTTVSATFSEAMDAATINTNTFELRNANNALVAATVSYNSANNTATLTPNAALTTNTTYTATVKGGTNGVKDQASNALAQNNTWSFTTSATGTSLVSIWDDAATPAVITDPDNLPVELGVKFRSDVDGYIKAIRFYKSPENTNTHVGTLWNNSGQQLAQITFSSETGSGWQQASFSTPVAINANTVYVVSYHTNVGKYSVTENYFTNSGVDKPPLHALRNGESGGNGVYTYSATSAFPSSSYASSNYWVDVLFSNTP
jgi:Domain of unknown function (DUF4082)/Bacterial Ig-like domain/Bacterial Ig domain